MKVLITGSHGFVGRHFVKRLVLLGMHVTGVDSLVEGSGARPFAEWGDTLAWAGAFEEQIVDVRAWFEQNRERKFDLVVHLAAVVGGRETIERNPMAVAEDLEIDAAFWRWVSTSRPDHVISFSSSAAYPISLQSSSESGFLLEEKDLSFDSSIGMPDLTYGWAKMTNEYLGRVTAKQFGIKVAAYRPFSGYGEDQDSSYPFRAICERAYKRMTDEEGNFFVWGSGDQKRDFVHIEDVIDCVMVTYPRLCDGEAINISTGRLTSFKELASIACRSVGWNPAIVGMEDKPAGVHSRGGHVGIQRQLGFEAKITLEEGVSRCMKYLESLEGSS